MQFQRINLDQLDQLDKLITQYYGHKLSLSYLSYDTHMVKCILYESFVVEISLGERYGEFGVTIAGVGMTKALGKSISPNSDAASIVESLDAIDNYCRLRLPDKFLVEYDKAYA